MKYVKLPLINSIPWKRIAVGDEVIYPAINAKYDGGITGVIVSTTGENESFRNFSVRWDNLNDVLTHSYPNVDGILWGGPLVAEEIL